VIAKSSYVTPPRGAVWYEDSQHIISSQQQSWILFGAYHVTGSSVRKLKMHAGKEPGQLGHDGQAGRQVPAHGAAAAPGQQSGSLVPTGQESIARHLYRLMAPLL